MPTAGSGLGAWTILPPTGHKDDVNKMVTVILPEMNGYYSLCYSIQWNNKAHLPLAKRRFALIAK